MKRTQYYNFGDHLHPESMLTFLYEIEPFVESSGRKRPQAVFLCECGKPCSKVITAIKSGKTKSCGCLTVTSVKEANTKHGFYSHELYGIWSKMIARTSHEHTKDYKDYGARGITVCESWSNPEDGFKVFVEDMGERPEGFTLERIDNDKGYCPGNVKWASRAEQSLNRRIMSNNTSGKTGVSFNKGASKWVVSIGVNGVQKIYLFTEDYDLAVFCREELEVHYYGKLLGH